MSATLHGAAGDAGLDPERLERWMANWSGGQRYTCPGYEIVRLADGVRIAVAGFQPFGVYDVITANLVPDLGRATPPASVEEHVGFDGFWTLNGSRPDL